MAINDTNTSLPLNGFGYLSVTSSAALSTLTANTNGKGNAYPTGEFPNQAFTITNNSTSVAYICPFGGTCSATVGIALPTASVRTFNVGNVLATVPTIISAGTSTVTVEW